MPTLLRRSPSALFVAAVLALAPFGCSKAPTVAAAAMCPEHQVEEKYCTICHPEIKNDPKVLLCKEHGDIPEAICTACHPELKSKYATCPHELPPAFCALCAKK